MTNLLFTQQWFILFLIFGVITILVWNRWRDRTWIEQRFGSQPIVVQSFGVEYFGRATEPGAPRRQRGFLLLLPTCLCFRSRRANVEIEIPISTIKQVYHDASHKGVDLHRSLVKVDFLTEQEQEDTVAFAVPYPPQWIQAIEKAIVFSQKSME